MPKSLIKGHRRLAVLAPVVAAVQQMNFSRMIGLFVISLAAFSAAIILSGGNGQPLSSRLTTAMVSGEEKIPAALAAQPGFDNWYATAQKELAAKEYLPIERVKDTNGKKLPKGTQQFANRSQNLRSYIGSSGWRLESRDQQTGGDWRWEYSLQTIGWDAAEVNLPTATAEDVSVSEDGTVTIRRGSVTEWYRNSAEGVEQGFEIAERPAGSGLLRLAAAVKTDLLGRTSGQEVIFATTGDDVLALNHLLAFDADGQELDARFVWDSSVKNLALVVDDRGAKYPVTIDPVATSPAWTAEPNQANAYFGTVASAGDVNGDGFSDVIIGAYGFDNGQADEGKVFVYHGSASGLAVSPSWSAEANVAGAYFGYSVASAGDVNGDGYDDVVIGAFNYANGQSGEGAAYVYHGSSSGLVASAAWTAESNQAGSNYGYSVSSAGDVNGDGYSDIVVGAWTYDNGESDEGAAFVYLGSASGIAGAATLLEINQASANFGSGVSSAGDVNGDGYSDVIVGAWTYANGQANEGAVFVFHGSGSGIATSYAWSKESNNVTGRLGYAVASAGDVNGDGYGDVIVGAYEYTNGQSYEGAAFVYLGGASGLAASPNWTKEGDQAQVRYGRSVSSAGDVNGDGYGDVIVGAYEYTNGQTYEGQAYVYLGSSTGVAATPTWTGESDQANGYYGLCVAGGGDVNGDGFGDILVGAQFYDNGEADEGRAYVYYGSATTPSAAINWSYAPSAHNQYLGSFIASAGDVNGDGYGDVMASGVSYNNYVYVFLGTSSGLASSPAVILTDGQGASDFGGAMAAGDLNGDGYSDIVVGASMYDDGQADEGAIFIYYGSASGISSPASLVLYKNVAGLWFGKGVAVGDVNGDGFGDLLAGAPKHPNAGAVFVYHGSSSGISSSSTTTSLPGGWNSEMGTSVSSGDVNGDGYADIIAGAPSYTNGQSQEGAVYVFHGSAGGASTTPAVVVQSNIAGKYFGTTVGTGDFNGDGYSDVVAGTSYSAGLVRTYHGSSSGVSATPAATFTPTYAYNTSPIAVASAGDVNGDGYADVIVGDPASPNTSDGVAYVHLGSPSGASVVPNWSRSGYPGNYYLGSSVGSAGDVNGDGYSDVIVGAPSYSHDGFNGTGQVRVYFGNNVGGRSISPRQLKTDGSVLPVLGMSDSGTGFKISMTAKPIAGRTKAKLIWEVKPRGTVFNGSSLAKSAVWTDTGTAGVTLVQTVTGLTPATQYHWRARVLYRSATGAQYSSPWVSAGSNSWNETDFNTSSIPNYTLTYTAGASGSITGTSPQTVAQGASGTQVTAVPDEYYDFDGWSDGVLTAARTDSNVMANITVTANFVYAAPPVAVADAYSIKHDGVLVVTAGEGVLANDTDADHDPLTAIKVTNPTHGTLSGFGTDGSFTYVPAAGYLGADAFTYKANDGKADSATIAVYLTVVNTAPVAVTDYYSIARGASIVKGAAAGVLANDYDANGDAISAVLVTGPAHGTLSIFDVDGSFTYVPTPGYTGSDFFTYKVNDGLADSSPIAVTVGPPGSFGNATQLAGAANAAPTVDAVVPSDVSGSGSLALPAVGFTLNEGARRTLYVRITVSDPNGCTDIAGIELVAYRSGVANGSTCTPDDNDCYGVTVLKSQLVGCGGAGDTEATFEAPLSFANFTDPTDAGSSHDGETWKALATVSDVAGLSSSLVADFEVQSLAALSVSPAVMDYGTVALGATSTRQTLTFTNVGNRSVNSLIRADGPMRSSLAGFADIASAQTHYSVSEATTWTAGTPVAATDTDLPLALPQQVADAGPAPTAPAYFYLKLPATGIRGTYTNTMYFTAYAR